MAPATPATPDGLPVLLRFGGVEVDAARHRLTVDGREVRVQRLVFHLLLALCEAQGRVLSRDALFAALWPEGTFRADESLSQLVFKLRGALGRYGDAVVTVRQVGVRLAADVQHIPIAPTLALGESDAAAAPIAATAPPVETTPPDTLVPTHSAVQTLPVRAGRPPVALILAALVVLALVAGMIARHRAVPVVVSAGFGLDAGDVQASSEPTIDALRRAFAADADGNQAAARLLMETVHTTDPHTPVPAMFLTYWYGGIGDAARATHWAAERDLRTGPHTPTYLALLARFLASRHATALERLKLQTLLLETRPGAALIRLARAHQHLQRNERDAALADLRQIDLRAAGRRRAPIVLGDRASLRDLAAVEAALRADDDALDAPGRAYAEARLRVAQGRYAEARALFDRALQHATPLERPDLVRDSAMHAAMMSAELGAYADARTRLEQAIQALRDERAYAQSWQASLLLATLPGVNPAEARSLLDRLAADLPDAARTSFCLDAELVAALLRLPTPPPLQCPAGAPDDYARRGGSALIQGLRAQQAGDTTAAHAALARATSEGIQATVLAPYAGLLVARLNGATYTGPIPDPPYPMWHRWALRWHGTP